MFRKFFKSLKKAARPLFLLLVLLSSIACFPLAASASSSKVHARAAIMIDQKTGQVLYSKNATKRYPVASCIKILTLLVIEDDIAHHRLSWNQKIKISKATAKMSTNWRFSNVELLAGHSYTVKALVESMMLVSADGSTEALALASAGSTKAFNKKMQRMAHKAGVTDAKIYNMIGLSNGELGKHGLSGVKSSAENLVSAKDMAKIAAYLLNHYPSVTKITSTKTKSFKISSSQEYSMTNINSMLPSNGVEATNGTIDGLKTGSTDKAGYCFVGSGTFSGRRVITVVLHVPGNYSNQFTQTQNMINIVLNRSQPVKLSGVSQLSTAVRSALVAHGKKKHTGVKVKSTTVWVPTSLANKHKWSASLKLSSKLVTITHCKLRAPIKKGERIGTITIHLKGMPDFKLPAYATRTVKKTSHWW